MLCTLWSQKLVYDNRLTGAATVFLPIAVVDNLCGQRDTQVSHYSEQLPSPRHRPCDVSMCIMMSHKLTKMAASQERWG